MKIEKKQDAEDNETDSVNIKFYLPPKKKEEPVIDLVESEEKEIEEEKVNEVID